LKKVPARKRTARPKFRKTTPASKLEKSSDQKEKSSDQKKNFFWKKVKNFAQANPAFTARSGGQQQKELGTS